ncbi:ABC transporter permease [bacterium]|nr:ABC transporter permease [bacterium]
MILNLQYIVKEGFSGLRRTRVATFVTVSTVAITFTLLGFFLLLTTNVGQFVGIFHEKMRLDVFIDNSLSDSSISFLEKQLLQCPGVKAVDYISPEKAMEQFKNEFGEDPLSILGENPLPASFHVYLKDTYHSPQKANSVVSCLESKAGVDEVIYQGRLFHVLHQYRRGLFIGTLILCIFVWIATLFLVSNTLRLTIYAQKEKIAIMELVGATPSFIRRPYLIQGLLQGLMGGSISTVLIWMVVSCIRMRFPTLLHVSFWIYLFPPILGSILGYLGSIVSVRRFLKT